MSITALSKNNFDQSNGIFWGNKVLAKKFKMRRSTVKYVAQTICIRYLLMII